MKLNKTIAESVMQQYLKDENYLYEEISENLKYLGEYIKDNYSFLYAAAYGPEYYTVSYDDDYGTIIIEHDEYFDVYTLKNGIPKRYYGGK